jgi:hypothetical protein
MLRCEGTLLLIVYPILIQYSTGTDSVLRSKHTVQYGVCAFAYLCKVYAHVSFIQVTVTAMMVCSTRLMKNQTASKYLLHMQIHALSTVQY